MKKFAITSCAQTSDSAVEKYVIGLSPVDMGNYSLFFPFSEEDAIIINYIFSSFNQEEKNDNKPSPKILGLYKTLVDSFENSGTFISGVIVDSEIVNGEDMLYCYLCISLIDGGLIENVMKTTFPNAMILASIHQMDILVTDSLFNKLIPNINEAEIGEVPKNKIVQDKNIEKIAKNIMNGAIHIPETKKTKKNKKT